MKKLEKGLDDTLENFKKEINFLVDTFPQGHSNEYLTKDDLEEIGKQVYYCLADFRDKIIEYLKAI
ncbi:MAG: hypothetical protein ABSC17_06000 [Thermacetogeniaceae bacterium]